MNLEQIRHLFRTLSGRHDLVDADSGKMADLMINEGSKFLDRITENQKTWASHFQVLAVDSWYVQFPYCRAVKEVWISTSTARWQLEKIPLQDILASYLTDLPPANRTSGVPEYYSPTITRYIPEAQTPLQLSAFVTYTEVIPISGYEYNTILLNIPVDDTVLIDVRGLFHSRELSTPTDENYWSSRHPVMLAMATMRQLEVINNKRAEVTTIEKHIVEEMTKLGMDLVEEIIAETDEMNG